MKQLLLLFALLGCKHTYSSDYGISSLSYQLTYSYVASDSIAHHDNFPTSNALPAHSLVVPPFFSSSHEQALNRFEAGEHKKAQLHQHTGSYRASYNDANDHYAREQQLIEWASALTHHAGKCSEWTKAQYWNALRAAYCVAVPIVPDANIPLCPHYQYITQDSTNYYFIHKNDLHAILHQWQLYDNAEFWRFIKELPQYDEWIEHLYTTHCSRHIKLSNKARRRLARERNALHQRKDDQRRAKEEQQHRQQQEAQRIQQEKEQRENERHQLIQQTYAYGNEYQQYAVEEWKKERNDNDISSDLYRALEQRLAAVAEIETHGLQYEYRSYSIEKEAHSLLQNMSYDAFSYEHCYGNQLQQALHKECVQLIESTSRILPTAALYSYQTSIAQCVEAARTYTHEGLLIKASRITDFCWTLFDYGKIIVASAAKGALHGIVGIAQTALDHPIETALTAVAPEYMLAFQLARITFNCAEIGMTYAIDPQVGKEQWNDYIAPLTALIEAISSKQLSLAQTIQTGTALVVGLIAQAKLLTGINTFYSVTKAHALEWMSNNPLLTPSHYLATAEGSVFKIYPVYSNNLFQNSKLSEKTLTHAAKNVLKASDERKHSTVEKLFNMQQLFKKNEFGKMLQENLTKLNQKYNNQSIYKVNNKINEYLKKGYYVYLDNLHFDHLEVFDGNKSAKFVLNLDGTLNLQ